MRALLLATWIAAVPAAAQVPVFSPLDPKPAQVPVAPPAEAVPQEKTALDLQFDRLQQWPDRAAKDAALVLAGMGPAARERLLGGLLDNDWRIRVASGFALGEMGAKEAIPVLVQVIRDPSNRAGLSVLMDVLGRLDPERSPEVLLPFLAHSSAAVRRDALRALPNVLPASYLEHGIELLGSGRPAVRAQGLDLLRRIPGGADRPEVIALLGDPDALVADAVARHLALVDSEPLRARLSETLVTAAPRRAAFALLSLVRSEDRFQGRWLSAEAQTLERLQGWLRGEDPFYRGVAAVGLAQLSHRSEAEDLRQLADGYLVPILVQTVAGGVYFADYRSVQDLCFVKLELLTGIAHGSDARRFERFWNERGSTFRARRELRALSSDDWPHLEVRIREVAAEGRETTFHLSGNEQRYFQRTHGAAVILDGEQLRRLDALLVGSGLFGGIGNAASGASNVLPAVTVVIEVGEQRLAGEFSERSAPGVSELLDFARARVQEESWQRFHPFGSSTERAQFLESERALRRASNPIDAAVRTASQAVAAYADISRADRDLALEALRRVPQDYLRQQGDALVPLLAAESKFTPEAEALLEVVLPCPLSDASRLRVVDWLVGVSGSRVAAATGRFLAAQPFEFQRVALRDERARVRAAAASVIVDSGDTVTVAPLLIQGLSDPDGDVREACVRALARVADPRVLGLLDAVIAGSDRSLRVRAIPALGRVGGEQVVPRLLELTRDEDRSVRYAAVRALAQSGGSRSVGALVGLVRDTGEMELRREALATLVEVGGAETGAGLLELLSRVREIEIRTLIVGGLARVLGAAATTHLEPLLADEDPSMRRVAVLTLGRLGARSALEPLLALLATAVEGDLAAERSFEALTFFAASERVPAKRAAELREFAQRFGDASRSEWFLLAAQRAQAQLDPDVDWLAPGPAPIERLQYLPMIVERGTPSARELAERWLLLGLELALDPLPAVATPDEALQRAGLYRESLAQRGR